MKKLMIALLILLIMLGGSLFFLVRWPQRILTEKNLKRIADYARTQGLDVTWSSFRIEAKPQTRLSTRIFLDLADLCVRIEGVSACFKSAHIELVAGFSGFMPTLREVGPVEVLGGSVNVGPQEPAKSPQAAGVKGNGVGPPSSLRLPRWVMVSKVSGVHIEVKSWTMPSESLSGRIDLRAYSEKNLRKFHSAFDAEVRMNVGPVKRITTKRCTVTFVPEAKTRIDLDCVLDVGVKLPRIEGIPRLRFRQVVPVELQAHLESDGLPGPDIPLRGEVSVEVKRYHPGASDVLKGVSTDIRILVRGEGAPARFPGEWKMDADVDVGLQTDRIDEVRDILSRTGWAIPAPISAMDGSVAIAFSGHADLRDAELPFRVATRLSSKQQKLNADASGVLNLQNRNGRIHPKLVAEIDLREVILVLPRIDFTSLPRIFPDSRIERETPEKGEAFEYDLRFITSSQPGYLITNLADAPVPIRMDLRLSSKAPVSATFSTEDVPLELFRRKAEVENMKLELVPDAEEVGGVIRVDYADYTVRINVFGTLAEPSYRFTSIPPLPEGEVLSVLLYGRTTEELDSNEAHSVGNLQAAVGARALSVASLYLLAATPIESVSYDPNLGNISVKLRLAEGTSLTVTTAGRATPQVAIRKRLGRDWSITSGYGTDRTVLDDKSVSALLEWSHRY